MGECPTGALKIVERETDEFDEEAVEKYLTEKEKQGPKEEALMPCGCPSTTIQTFFPAESRRTDDIPAGIGPEGESALSHWLVQIRLIPAKATLLKEADILVLADCVAVAFSTLHRDLIKGKVVMMGCPKLR